MRPEVARVVYPVLNYGLRLKERREHGEEPELDAEQVVLKGLLNAPEGRHLPDYWGEADPQRMGDDPFLGIRYALTCWLDEILIDTSPWGTNWDNRKLEWDLFNSADRGWKFRLQATKAESRSAVDAVEAFMLCIMMGFRGDWLENRAALQTWVNANQMRIAKFQQEQWPAPPGLPVPRTNVPPLRGWERFQRVRRWRSIVVLFAILIGVVLLVSGFLSS
jgi:type VI secretion system protein ImpK